jgi:glycoside/pentoside/hexuronide:cation symporter, GPH family
MNSEEPTGSAARKEEVGPIYHRRERDGPVPFATKAYWGIGAIPDTVMNFVFGTFILLFYNQVLGVGAFQVSLALALAIIVDAFLDPSIAAYTDNLRTRWGRRHPLMLLGGVPLGAFSCAVFMPPGGLTHFELSIWLAASVICSRIAMSVYQIPWSAMAAELSDDYNERTSVMAFRSWFGLCVSVLFPFVVYSFIMTGSPGHPVGQLNGSHYPVMAISAGALMTVFAVASTLLTRREIPYLRQHVRPQPRPSLGQTFVEIRRALSNRQFSLIFLIVLLLSAIGGTTSNLGIYMTTFFWGLGSQDLRWFSLSAVGAIAAFPLLGLVQRKWEKKQIWLVTGFLSLADGMVLISLRFLGILPENGDPGLLVVLVGTATFSAAIGVIYGVIASSVVADVLDQHELQTGYRQEAMFNAALSFCGKAVSGIGIVLGGLILGLVGMPQHADPATVPTDTVNRLGIIVGLGVQLFYLAPLFLISRYRITRKVHSEIRQALALRRTAQSTDGA